MKVIVQEVLKNGQVGGEEYLGEFKNIKEAKRYWIQGDTVLRDLVRKKKVKFVEVIDF